MQFFLGLLQDMGSFKEVPAFVNIGGFLFEKSKSCCELPWCLGSLSIQRPLFAQKVDKWEFPKIRDTILGGPYNMDSNMLGSLGSPLYRETPK